MGTDRSLKKAGIFRKANRLEGKEKDLLAIAE
jgi:hypothetical protein